MAYDPENFTKLGDLKLLAQRTSQEIAKASATASDGIKYVSVSGNTISFWKDAEHSGAADFTVDFPSELFLDQTRTTFVPKFKFSASSYPGATNPSLDDKPVLVFAVKTTTDRASGTAEDTFAYSFLDMETLVDTYTVKDGDSAKILTIDGYELEVHISAAANNALKVKSDGLHVDISGKADKVENATEGHLAGLDANGNLTDSGHGVATTTETTEMLNEVFGTPASGD